ncbi:MAG TPA: hypothetical protein VMY40_10060 [Anaerolineae bacterium]|nr:hypothetical protein [Anaerolineae bacterium]
MIFAVLSLLDLLTTYLGGLHNEMNPVTWLVLERYGLLGFALGKVALTAYFVITAKLIGLFHERWAASYRGIMCGIGAVVVAWNVRYLVLR